MKTDRYFINSTSLKSDPVLNGRISLTGSFEADFTDLTLYNYYTSGGTAQLVATWSTTTVIEGSTTYQVKATMPCVRFDGETPNVGGPEMLTNPLNFTVLDDGTNAPITFLYRTSDAAD